MPVSRCGDRVLTAGHAVVEVVGDDERDADVTARDVEQVRAADTATTVSFENDDGQFRSRQFQSAGIGDRTAVQPVESMGNEVAIGKTDAADVGDDHNFFRIWLQFNQRLVQRVNQSIMSATRTERQGADFVC